MTPAPTGHGDRVVWTDREQEPWRSDAQVDVDRLLYSPEFRRLAGVTQVVPPQDDFHFHDRLSHSIKVAQVAETLARMLLHQARDDRAFADVDLELWVDPSHCYAAGLAHDIGHPPFGHAGEEALQAMLDSSADEGVEFWEDDGNGEDDDQATDVDGRTAEGGGPRGADAAVRIRGASDSQLLAARSFEGNAQSIRVVAKLSIRGDDLHAGLNLTLRTLAAIAKYPWLRGQHPTAQEKLAKKWSFYPEESDVLDRLTGDGFVRVERGPDGAVSRVDRWVEAEIMDWADDISYAVHDVDDFYRAGLIPLGQIAIALESAPRVVDWYTTDFDFVDDDAIRYCLLYISEKLKRFQGRQVDLDDELQRRQFTDAFTQIQTFARDASPRAPFSGTRQSHRDLQRFSSAIIGYLSAAAQLVFDHQAERVQLYLDPTRVLVAEFFKAVNSYFVIESVSLAAMQYGQVENLGNLFDAMIDMASEWMGRHAEGKISGRLPARLRSYLTALVAQSVGGVNEGDIAVAVLDYITSLRDVQAAHLAAQLAGAREAPALSGHWLNT